MEIKILVTDYFISNKGSKIKKSIKKLNMHTHYDPMISLPEKTLRHIPPVNKYRNN